MNNLRMSCLVRVTVFICLVTWPHNKSEDKDGNKDGHVIIEQDSPYMNPLEVKKNDIDNVSKDITYTRNTTYDINISSNDDKAIPKGDSLNIVETECTMCKKKFKNENNLKTHDLRYHIKKGTENVYSCKYFAQTFSNKGELVGHITSYHKKCNVCENIFPSPRDINMHMKAVHKRDISKHSLAREPSLRNHKNKTFI